MKRLLRGLGARLQPGEGVDALSKTARTSNKGVERWLHSPFLNALLSHRETEPIALETSATELQIMILQQLPDVFSLGNLVYAVPSYHSAHIPQRSSILSGVLLRSIEPEVLVDALAVCKSLNTHRDESNRAPMHEVRNSSTTTDSSEAHVWISHHNVSRTYRV